MITNKWVNTLGERLAMLLTLSERSGMHHTDMANQFQSGCSSMAELLPSKQKTRVRFPLPAPNPHPVHNLWKFTFPQV